MQKPAGKYLADDKSFHHISVNEYHLYLLNILYYVLLPVSCLQNTAEGVIT